MIAKMKFLSISGPKEDIDRLVTEHLSHYEIHLENALAELKSVKNLTPYIQINPYRDDLKKAEEYVSLLSDQKQRGGKTSVEDAVSLIEKTTKALNSLNEEKKQLETECRQNEKLTEGLAPFRDIPVSLDTLRGYQFIRSRVGRIPREYYPKFETYIYKNSESLWYQSQTDREYVYGIYFTPKDSLAKVDAMYASMHFEEITPDPQLKGTPADEFDRLTEETRQAKEKIAECDKKIQDYLNKQGSAIIGARNALESVSETFDIRKLAVCTMAQPESFYILCGWMEEKDAAAFQKEVANDENIYCVIEDHADKISKQPPTKLKNPKIFKPFEMFVRMYGLPGYQEFDPTIYLAISYSFIFGIMFGDFGQGLCLVIGGLLLYKYRHMDLAGIIGCAGIFSVIWGLVYNSFFGFEGFLPYEALIHPKDDMTTLPVIGSLNTVFVLAIAFGMIMILINMIMNIINAVRAKDAENIWFSQNSVAGLVFYGTIVIMVFVTMSGHGLGALLPVLLVLVIFSLAVIFLKEMLGRIASKKKPAIEGGKGMYFVQAFFETFETILSYLSNTLSYVRIGAYAVSHVAMMEVVMMLSGGAQSPNPIGIVIGNLFVMAMEGLMVGIQVLRLEYYEMFSRFYKGDGREFKPFITHPADAERD